MRPIPAVAADQCGVFTSAQATQLGWTSHALRHAVSTEQLQRIRRSVYALGPAPTASRYADDVAALRRRAAAVNVANPAVPVSHTAAGAILDLWLLDTPAAVCVTYPRGRRDHISGTHRHRARLTPRDVVRVGRIRLTSPERTVLDIAREHGAAAGIAAADSALRLGYTDHDALRQVALHAAGWPGARSAAHALENADGRSESALESVSRLRMLDALVPHPEPQPRVFNLSGRFVGRVDFYWDEFGVVGEADGLGKYEDAPRSLTDEKLRQEALEQCGLIVVRWGWFDLTDFAGVATRLRDAFARGLRRDRLERQWRIEPTPAWPRARAVS